MRERGGSTPANVKVRDDGTVKVLDFGLAKAMDSSGPASASASDLANSPTITSPAMTQMGMTLGTAAYMAPEQARGRPVDKRADTWAFGVVLYEMLTGQRTFEGGDVAEVLSRVLQREPDFDALPVTVPAAALAVPALRTLGEPSPTAARVARLTLDLAPAERLDAINELIRRVSAMQSDADGGA